MKKLALGFLFALSIVCGMGARPQQGRAATAPSSTDSFYVNAASPADASDDSLVAKGKDLYASYHCSDCHGMNGEGSDSAPALTDTHLSADEIAAFLEKPSPDARGAGMPTIPADSPDLKPLVAYVVSLKKTQ